MDEHIIKEIVPLKLYGIEKIDLYAERAHIDKFADKPTYKFNLLYENTVDPGDNIHRFSLLPDNPNFLRIKKVLDDYELELDEIPLIKLSKLLSDSLNDMYGARVIVDMSKTPICRVYSQNVTKLVAGKLKTIHKAGDPIHKKDPWTKQELPELDIMTRVPVWGFCRKAPNGKWVWMKDYAPIVRIQRDINLGFLVYVDIENDCAINIEKGKRILETSGFIRGYAYDQDYPNLDNHLFLIFNVLPENGMLHKQFKSQYGDMFVKTYIKYIDFKPYNVYVFKRDLNIINEILTLSCIDHVLPIEEESLILPADYSLTL